MEIFVSLRRFILLIGEDGVAAKLRDGFVDAYNRYYALVFSTAYAKLGSADDAMDIAQEVFIRLYEKFAQVENPRKWLYGTLRNVTLDHFKKKRPEFNSDDFDDMGITYMNGFRDTRIMIQEAMELEDNFESEEEKILFELIATYNFSYREAGEQAGMSEIGRASCRERV